MWHEARRQERKIRGMLVDYRRRAERRRDFYEKIKADPTQFLQLHGRQCKIHLDPAIAAAADSPAAMMPWQGQTDNLIDRFDVRAHLDYIPPIKKQEDEELNYEERQLNYERYRIIAQNSFLNISEEKFLKQLHLEEQFGYTEAEPKKKKTGGAAIGFNYDDNTGTSQAANFDNTNEAGSDENSDSDLDVDLSINISKIDQFQAHEMNRHGRNFGMSSNDFYSFLTNDLEEAESYRIAREEEHEKSLFSGRKSRRERRAHREKRLANRVISPPSYAARISPTYPTFRESKSASKSPSPENTGKITYITSFGDEEEPTTSKPTYADKVKHGKSKKNKDVSTERTVFFSNKRNSTSRDRERNYNRKRFKSRSSSRTPRSKYRSRSRERFRRSRSSSRNCSRSYRSRRSSSSSSDRKSKSRNKSSSSSRSERSDSTTSKTSRSRSSSSSSSSSSSRSKKSRSPSIKRESPPKVVTLPRYYGRKRSDQSSSELSHSEEEGINKPEPIPAAQDTRTSYGNTGSSIKKTSTSLSLQERLKRKRQALLNKQFKADKIAEQLKTEREKQEQQNREDELREMAIKLRRRQRERRHAYDSNNSNSSSDSEKKAKSPAPGIENRPKSRSASPKIKREDRDRDRKRDRDERRRNSPVAVIRRSPKRYDVEKRVVHREDTVSERDRDRNYRRRDDEQHRRDSRDIKRNDYNRERGNRSLVDY